MKHELHISSLFFVLLFFGLTAFFSMVEADEQRTEFIAFSLREAECIARDSASSNTNRMGGIGEVIGFIIDNTSKDIIILGKSNIHLPPLTLDDIVTLLRSAQIGGISGPGVSLEPQEGGLATGELDVVLFGGISGTSLGLVSFKADYLMKEIALNKVRSGVNELETYVERTKKFFDQGKIESWNVLSRFWFAPIYTPIVESELQDLYLLREVKVGVLVETLSAEIDGKPDINFKDKPAEDYARQFRYLYDKIAEHHSEFVDLKRFMGALKLFSVLLTRVKTNELDFWLKTYHPGKVNINSHVPLLKDISRKGNRELTLVGGVRLAGITARIRNGEVAAIRDAILKMRPSHNSLSWKVTFTRDWRIFASIVSPRDQTIADLLVEGLIQQKKECLVEAIRSYDQILQGSPDIMEVIFLKAICNRDLAIQQGKVNSVLQPLEVLMQLAKEKPLFLEIHYEIGVTLYTLGRTNEAIEVLKKIIQIRPDFPPAHYAIGRAYMNKGDDDLAKTHLEHYLSIASGEDKRWIRAAEQFLNKLKKVSKNACSSEDAKFERFVDEKFGFECLYPWDWKIVTSDKIMEILPHMAESKNTVVAFIDSARPDENINIQVMAIAMDALTDQGIRNAIPALTKAYEARFSHFQKVEAGPVNICGIKGIKYVFKSERAGVTIEQCVVTLVKARKAYTIALTAPEHEFAILIEKYFDKILSSFQIGKR